jgi:hypothetical protein
MNTVALVQRQTSVLNFLARLRISGTNTALNTRTKIQWPFGICEVSCRGALPIFER